MMEAKSNLDQISTRWQTLNDPLQFVMRYAPAIHNYLCALLKNPHDADEVSQEFLLRVQQHGFANANPERGRFRDYLKKAIRNAGLNHLQRAHPRERVDERGWTAEIPAGLPPFRLVDPASRSHRRVTSRFIVSREAARNDKSKIFPPTGHRFRASVYRW